jgi:hypothetical protein
VSRAAVSPPADISPPICYFFAQMLTVVPSIGKYLFLRMLVPLSTLAQYNLFPSLKFKTCFSI